jgi:hypothetical protein
MKSKSLTLATRLMLLVGFFLAFTALAQVADNFSTTPPAPYVEPVVENPAEALTEGLNCWGNDGKAHPLPTLVIFKWDGKDEYEIGGSREVGLAFDELPKSIGGLGLDRHLSVYRFCVDIPTEKA